MALGTTLTIDDRTVLVLGQELDIAGNQPDVANVLLHRTGPTLVMVDTGVTKDFRQALAAAAGELGDWSRLLLLTTHGHVDHVGNDDLVDELARGRDAVVEHYVPAADVAQMRDPARYWLTSFQRIAGLAPLPAAPRLVAHKIVSMFRPLHPFGATTATYESRPLESVSVGSQTMTGWTFADGAVTVFRTQGHDAGHVGIHLRDSGVLHLGDETNGAFAVMHDADQVKLATAHRSARRMIDDGVVTALTDGHEFQVADAAGAAARLDALIAQAVTLRNAALTLTTGRSALDIGEFLHEYTRTVAELEVGGPNPNPVFTAMMASNTLRDLGWAPDGAPDGPWRQPTLGPRNRSAPATATDLAVGAAQTVPWLLRGRHRPPHPH